MNKTLVIKGHVFNVWYGDFGVRVEFDNHDIVECSFSSIYQYHKSINHFVGWVISSYLYSFV